MEDEAVAGCDTLYLYHIACRIWRVAEYCRENGIGKNDAGKSGVVLFGYLL